MSRIKNAFKGLFGSTESAQEEVAPINSFADLKIGNSFTIKMCDVYEVMGHTFEVIDLITHVVSTDHTPIKVLTVQDIETGSIYRAASLIVNGRLMVRLDKEMTTEQVSDVFFDLDWVQAETEEDWVDPTDFRFIFDESVNASFKLKRFNMGDETTIKAFDDWTAEEYTFHENLGIEGYTQKNGFKEAVQSYFLSSPNKDYGIVIEVDEQGVARVFASHLMLPTSIIDMI